MTRRLLSTSISQVFLFKYQRNVSIYGLSRAIDTLHNSRIIINNLISIPPYPQVVEASRWTRATINVQSRDYPRRTFRSGPIRTSVKVKSRKGRLTLPRPGRADRQTDRQARSTNVRIQAQVAAHRIALRGLWTDREVRNGTTGRRCIIGTERFKSWRD